MELMAEMEAMELMAEMEAMAMAMAIAKRVRMRV
jgi:hypothetical protein